MRVSLGGIGRRGAVGIGAGMGHGRRAEDRAPLVALGVGEEATALLVVVGRQRDTAHGDEVRGVKALECFGALLPLYGQGLACA